MHELKWSEREKKIARQVYESARLRELDEIVAEFKAMTARIDTPDDLWPLEDYLRHKRKEINDRYDYRYSQLPMLFGTLLRERRIVDADLMGLSEDKMRHIHNVAAL